MSHERTKALLRSLARNEEFRKETEAAPDFEARFKVFAEYGFGDITEADLRAVKAELALPGAEGALTDVELEVVSGGRDGTTAWVGVLVRVLALL